MILDTNALSAFFEGDPPLKAIVAKAVKISLPVIVLGEYRFGLFGSRLRKVIEPALDGLQAMADILPVDAETVLPYAKLCDQLKRAGTPIPFNDLWIAALSVQHGLPIVSRDKHFDLVPGILRVTW
ncbi:MAG: type II toxin-antitoxin system VapC family toxin [Chthoniobacter sp.]|uniref:type II toxin-antitoxin system VapC family toxin n=1 Tax=Chthoniobacter sp. TaxID=2510640 RepID=UPI0032A99199